jgi:hypothetical protein
MNSGLLLNTMWRKTEKRSGRYSSSLLGSFLFFLGLMSSGVKETVPVSLETVERLCLGSSLPAGSASAILIRELTACLATTRSVSCQILQAKWSGGQGSRYTLELGKSLHPFVQ